MNINPERHGQLVEHHMEVVLWFAANISDDAWQKAAVCKYMRKLVRDMTVIELEVLTQEELGELTYRGLMDSTGGGSADFSRKLSSRGKGNRTDLCSPTFPGAVRDSSIVPSRSHG